MDWPSISAFTEPKSSMGPTDEDRKQVVVGRKPKIARFFRRYHSNPSVGTPLQYEKYQQVSEGTFFVGRRSYGSGKNRILAVRRNRDSGLLRAVSLKGA